MHPKLIVRFEVSQGFVLDEFLHVGGFVERNGGIYLKFTFAVLSPDRYGLLAGEVVGVGDVEDLCDLFDLQIAAEL